MTTINDDAQLTTADLHTVRAELQRIVAETATDHPGDAILTAEIERIKQVLRERQDD